MQSVRGGNNPQPSKSQVTPSSNEEDQGVGEEKESLVGVIGRIGKYFGGLLFGKSEKEKKLSTQTIPQLSDSEKKMTKEQRSIYEVLYNRNGFDLEKYKKGYPNLEKFLQTVCIEERFAPFLGRIHLNMLNHILREAVKSVWYGNDEVFLKGRLFLVQAVCLANSKMKDLSLIQPFADSIDQIFRVPVAHPLDQKAHNLKVIDEFASWRRQTSLKTLSYFFKRGKIRGLGNLKSRHKTSSLLEFNKFLPFQVN